MLKRIELCIAVCLLYWIGLCWDLCAIFCRDIIVTYCWFTAKWPLFS